MVMMVRRSESHAHPLFTGLGEILVTPAIAGTHTHSYTSRIYVFHLRPHAFKVLRLTRPAGLRHTAIVKFLLTMHVFRVVTLLHILRVHHARFYLRECVLRPP